MKKSELKKLMLAAIFIAIGLVLPFFTGQIKQIGSMLLPMHLPVFLCGLICGWKYGAVTGFTLPLLRSLLFSMPVLYPSAVAMAFELCAYGLIAGYVYGKSRWQCTRALYRALLCAMLGGRAVWGIVMTVISGLGETEFTAAVFLTSAFVNAVPGIIIQLVLIPALMLALNKTHLVPFKKEVKEQAA